MSPGRFQLGVNTCFAVKRWPQPEEWASIVADVLGVDLVQHTLDLVDLNADVGEQADLVRAACADHGLVLDSVFTGLAAYSTNLLLDPDEGARRRAMRWWQAMLAFAARAGAGSAGGHVGSLSVAEWRDPVRRGRRDDDLRRALDQLTRDAHAAGLDAVLIENMASAREPSTMAQVEALLRPPQPEQAAVALCLDVGHACVPGTTGDERDPYAWLRRLGPRSPIIHLQQSDADGDHHWPFTAHFNAQGRIDADRVLDALEEGGVREAKLILEVIFPFEADDDDVLAAMRESTAYWRQALDARDRASGTTEDLA